MLGLSAAFNFLLGQVYALIGYITGNYTFPKPLSKAEEAIYLAKLQKGDEEAKNILIEHNLRLVAHVAKKYINAGKEQEDLISIGTIGLIKAINSYNCEKCTKLATYAARCIENEILMVIRSEKKLKNEVSLYDPLGFDADGNEVKWIDVIGSDTDDVFGRVELKTGSEKLYNAVEKILTPTENTIIKYRYGLFNTETKSQREIAKMLGISRSYVSRIEKKAVEKLTKHFGE